MKFIILNFEANSPRLVETIVKDDSNNFGAIDYKVEIEIPILPAYSIGYFGVQLNGVFQYDEITMVNPTKVCIDFLGFLESPKSSGFALIIYYIGIRDYDKLFHWVADVNLMARLGQYYEEAEKAFDAASWLSFSLMCGAIFEGILYGKGMYVTDFNTSIDNAFKNAVIDSNAKDIMHKVRMFRNLVHANNYNKPYVTRVDAMDIRSVLDKLLIRF